MIVYMMVNFLINGKKLTLYPYIRKEMNRVWKIRVQSLYSIFVAKCFNVSFITKCLPFLLKKILITPNQSGFRLGYSCVNQLLPIIHQIYKSFHEGFEVAEIFLNISKASDKVWHESLLLKLNQNGISENLWKLLGGFLSCRK